MIEMDHIWCLKMINGLFSFRRRVCSTSIIDDDLFLVSFDLSCHDLFNSNSGVLIKYLVYLRGLFFFFNFSFLFSPYCNCSLVFRRCVWLTQVTVGDLF